MKKLILGAAALMIGGVVAAQSTADIQTADNHSGNALANTADVEQGTDGASDFQKVRILQVGESNSVVSNQDGVPFQPMSGDLLEANSADVVQLGNDNAAEVDQDGFGNLGSIAQDGGDADDDLGGGNAAILTQNNSAMGTEGNTGIIVQGTAGVDDVVGGAELNEATLTQDGSANAGQIVQLFDNNDAVVDQNGTSNISSVYQEAEEDLADGMEAAVDQDGTSNESTISQSANESIEGTNSGRSVATTTQDGSFNRALQVQTSTAQSGEVGETATILQTGEYATAIQDQSGKSNEASIDQSGNGTAAEGDYAKQRQSGGNHTAVATQVRAEGGTANFSFQDQQGWDNQSTNTQNGFGNKAQSKQIGNNNVGFITQTDNGGMPGENSALTVQMGNDSYSATVQAGGGNMAYNVQLNGQSSKIDQDGWGNEAAVYQGNAGSGIATDPNMVFGTRYEFDTPDISLEMVPNLTMESAPYED